MDIVDEFYYCIPAGTKDNKDVRRLLRGKRQISQIRERIKCEIRENALKKQYAGFIDYYSPISKHCEKPKEHNAEGCT